MDTPAVSKFAYSHSENDIFCWTNGYISWRLEQDILVFSIVSKFRKVPFEITRARDATFPE